MKENKKDIKEILELLDTVQLLSVNFAKALKNGKIGIEDLPLLLNLLKNIQVIINGINGIKDIPKKLGDIDKKEAIRIGSKVYEIISEIQKENKK